MNTTYSNHGHTFDRETFRSPPAGACCLEKNIGETERAFSLAAGVGLGLAGLARGGMKGLALTAVGAGLVWRGYTGHCQTYKFLGINNAQRNPATSVPARQGVKLDKTIIVSRPAADLYRFWRRLVSFSQAHHDMGARGAAGMQPEIVALGETERQLVVFPRISSDINLQTVR